MIAQDYSAAGSKLKEQLSGQVELDATYTKINLKGTRKEDMPRISKKRGKHKTSLVSKELAGISHRWQQPWRLQRAPYRAKELDATSPWDIDKASPGLY
jgi:hypothetical protein